jgi:hypothetical protein
MVEIEIGVRLEDGVACIRIKPGLEFREQLARDSMTLAIGSRMRLAPASKAT